MALQKGVDVFPLCLKVAPNFLNIEALGQGLVKRSLELSFLGKIDLNEDAMLAGVESIADGVHRLASCTFAALISVWPQFQTRIEVNDTLSR